MWKAMIISGAIVGEMVASRPALAQAFVPPAGYSDDGETVRPGVAVPIDPQVPLLTRLPDASLSGLFHLDPSYSRAKFAHLKVIGAFTIAEPADVHLVDAWSPGDLPLALSFSDGRCFLFLADFFDGTLSNGRMVRVACDQPRPADLPPPPLPAGLALRRVGYAWTFGAWADDRTGTTVVSAPESKTFEPLFAADMTTSAITAIIGPDYPGANVTLVGRIKGQLTVVTLDVGF